jgi:hypothetical protein
LQVKPPGGLPVAFLLWKRLGALGVFAAVAWVLAMVSVSVSGCP